MVRGPKELAGILSRWASDACGWEVRTLFRDANFELRTRTGRTGRFSLLTLWAGNCRFSAFGTVLRRATAADFGVRCSKLMGKEPGGRSILFGLNAECGVGNAGRRRSWGGFPSCISRRSRLSHFPFRL